MLKAYLDFFNKTAKEWARTSEKYEDRNRKKDFSSVMSSMSSFVKRLVGLQKYPEVNEKLEKFLVINNYVTRNSRGSFDVTPSKYSEYKK